MGREGVWKGEMTGWAEHKWCQGLTGVVARIRELPREMRVQCPPPGGAPVVRASWASPFSCPFSPRCTPTKVPLKKSEEMPARLLPKLQRGRPPCHFLLLVYSTATSRPPCAMPGLAPLPSGQAAALRPLSCFNLFAGFPIVTRHPYPGTIRGVPYSRMLRRPP